MTKQAKGKTKFIELKKIYETLHGDHGCMWDKEQTHASLLKDLKEEVDEFIHAVKHNDYPHMQEEIGDILLHVMFQAQIASKSDKFDIEDVIDGLIKKIKRRHPHVFGDEKVRSTKEIIANWHKIKKLEKQPRRSRKKAGRI
jgi:tetrapyrrole methylase family protein / MazG family protein